MSRTKYRFTYDEIRVNFKYLFYRRFLHQREIFLTVSSCYLNQ